MTLEGVTLLVLIFMAILLFMLGTTVIAVLRRIEALLARIIKRWAALENIGLFPEEEA